jgi:hypothetical protein
LRFFNTTVVAVLSLVHQPSNGREPADAAIVSSDVAMSEFTPPLRLLLDSRSGTFFLAPPFEGWPSALKKPQARSGTLSSIDLQMVRRAINNALTSGLVDQACVKVNGEGFEPIVSNSAVPQMTVIASKKVISTTSLLRCWTKSAFALHQILESKIGQQRR